MKMLIINAIADYFKYKIATSIIVIACWPAIDRIKFVRQLTKHDLLATFTCNMSAFETAHPYRFQGVLAFQLSDTLMQKTKVEYFSHWYKWVIVGNITLTSIKGLRYDADMMLIDSQHWTETTKNNVSLHESKIYMKDIYIHPSEGTTLYPWAVWSRAQGLQVTHDRERILRRLNLKRYPLKIASPMGLYSEDTYEGTFKDYVTDISTPERDPGIRCGYGGAALITEALNATERLIGTQLWSTEVNNSSMILMVSRGTAELGGGILRVLHNRITRLDYVLSIWPFRDTKFNTPGVQVHGFLGPTLIPVQKVIIGRDYETREKPDHLETSLFFECLLKRYSILHVIGNSVGFTYLAERESSKNMFVEPFTASVWGSCLALVVLLAVAQRLMARRPEEKEGAYIAVLASYLQQDASAVPEGISGRLTFIVLSVSSMLIHAYYTSAIVSALMSTGMSGPDSLTSLAESRYAISSEDYDYMRYLMFDVETNRDDLEYLKRKKKTSKFYQDIERGVQLIQEGNTAYHTEYNQVYPRLKSFTDDQICKLQYVDTVPETMTWVTTTKRGQWVQVFKSKGQWLHETGLVRRLLSRLKRQPPPCRASLLAERVKFGDVVPAILLSILGAVMSFFQLGIEIIFSRWKAPKKTMSSNATEVEVYSLEDE